MRIAVDAMGGDHAPRSVVEGAVLAAGSLPDAEIILVGVTDLIEAELERVSHTARVDIHHAEEVIAMDEPSKAALREKSDSSITKSVRLLKDGEVDAVMSAGHTGAAVAASTILLGRLSGIRRPGLSAPFPARNDKVCLVIDVGANIGCEPMDLLRYGEMAAIFLEIVHGISNPIVGLMSVGSEAAKGNKLVKETQHLFEESHLNYVGNAEGRDIFSGDFDVVVCDGFVGNVMLKSLEGFADWVTGALTEQLSRTWWLKLGAAVCKPGFRELHKRLDTAGYGGAALLGVDGNVIITHGAAEPRQICCAIECAERLAREKVNERIITDVTRDREPHDAEPSVEVKNA